MIKLQNDQARMAILPEVGGSVLYFDMLVDGEWYPVMRRAEQADDVNQCASFPLAPFCGRIRDGNFTFNGRRISLPRNRADQKHAIHGQAWLHPWKVDAQSETEARLSFTYEPGDWPWKYEVEQHFRLEGAALEMTMTMRNLDREPMPGAIGFHPYFDKSSPVFLSTFAKDVWMIDDEVMPTELVPAEGEWALGPDKPLADFVCDQNFQHWSREAVLRWPERDLAVSITADEAFPVLVIYCPEGKPFFCFEPAGNVADAVNAEPTGDPALDMPVLQPGEVRAGGMRISRIEV